MGNNGENIKDIKEEAQPIIQMVITFNPNSSQVQITGPIQNRTLAYGMLEMAKEAIYDFKEKNKVQIEKPKGDLMNFLRQRR